MAKSREVGMVTLKLDPVIKALLTEKVRDQGTTVSKLLRAEIYRYLGLSEGSFGLHQTELELEFSEGDAG